MCDRFAVSLLDSLKSEVEVTVLSVVIEDVLFFGAVTVEEKVRLTMSCQYCSFFCFSDLSQIV